MRRGTAKLTVELKKKKPFERTHIDGSLHLPATKLPRRQMRKSERVVEEGGWRDVRQHFYYTRGVSVQRNVMLAAHIAGSVVYGST